VIAGGGTDWEYVFRVTDIKGSRYEFSGGNHGREGLKNIRLLNGDTNADLHLETGQTLSLDSLKIIETTTLAIDDSLTKKFADVTRTYRIIPSKITLDTDFCFISDVYMGTSYICMMPVIKSFGRYAKFLDSGNVYTTPERGKTLTTGSFENFLGKEKSLAVEIWGDNPSDYSFKAAILNADMADNFKNKNKVFYWDMNTESNKLYFSKFDNEEFRPIKAGTQWHTEASWELLLKR
jgi:hypothetical protein